MWRRILLALLLMFVISQLLARFGGILLPGWAEVVLYLGLYAVLGAVWPRGTPAAADPAPDLPLSGPAGRHGAAAYSLRFTLSALLTLFNPWLFWQQMRQIGGQVAIALRYPRGLPTPAALTPAALTPAVRYRLPFDGTWYIVNGGITPQTSHSWEVLTQRYAYDFVIVDDGLARHARAGDALTDYYCYDRPILAVADGEVVALRNDVRDAPRVGHAWADVGTRDIRGNFVCLRHAEGQYSVYAHLRPGSVCVQVGQRVAQGAPLGRCGHSGMSTEPHLHFHFQDRADFFSAAGLPLPFSDVSVDGHPPTAAVYLTRYTHVTPHPPSQSQSQSQS